MATTTIWYAGKEMQRGKRLVDYLGTNEKTTAVVKLAKMGTGAPLREPTIDQATHKQMLTYYYKKQEEAKKFDEIVDDRKGGEPWADPKGLKGELEGVSEVKWKFK